jgi:3-oxoacyl-[acyl-carrier protein] reductase
MNLTTKKPTCFITGCSGYIGSHIATILTKQNWQILGVSRNKDMILKFPHINWLIGDLTDLVSIESLLNKIDEGITFDAIIHCAGISPDQTIFNLEPIPFETGLSLNFLSVQKINQHLIKRMNKNSSIIHFGSRIASHGNLGQIAYGTSKGILADYTKLLAAEIGKTNITVNLILPGVHPSQILGQYKNQIIENATNESLLHRLTHIDDVTNAVLYLLQARSVSGQVFAIESRLIE